jgi:hypothetical protein
MVRLVDLFLGNLSSISNIYLALFLVNFIMKGEESSEAP